MKKIFLLLTCFLAYNSDLFGQCSNADFESSTAGAYTSATGVSGWTVSSQTVFSTCSLSSSWTPGSNEFSIVSTPIINAPEIGILPNSPFGGTKVALLNSTLPNNSATRLTRTIAVTNSNALFSFAYAGVWQNGGHVCCDQPIFQFNLRDGTGTLSPCYTTSVVAAGGNCPTGAPGYTTSSTASWTNWQVKYIDLSPFINSTITIEITVADCTCGSHYGMLFFDASCNTIPSWIPCLCTVYPGNITQANFCPGSNQAILQAPLGYSTYSWIAPGGAPISTNTSPVLVINNPIANSVYTVYLTNPSGCVFVASVVVTASQVNINTLVSAATCSNGTSGSATVLAQGSSMGYNYVWANSTNSVVSTSSVLSNAGPGVYNVTITAAGSYSGSCGTATASTTISAIPSGTIGALKPFCGNMAYLSANGSSFQWYNNTTPITSSLGGTASSFTVVNPTNAQSNIWVGYTSSQGCRDSVNFFLVATNPGSVTVQNISTICQGGNNGTALVNMVPTNGSLSGSNTFSVWGTSTLNSTYVATLAPTAQNQFSLSGLSAGTYSVKAFDGSCVYTKTFVVTPFIFNYTLSPNNSPTLCSGNSIAASVNFTSFPSPGQYTYSWSPNQFLTGNNATLQSNIITPTAQQGTINTIVYTVVVTPSVINCPLVKTVIIHVANSAQPTIQAVPGICYNKQFTVSVNPPGGSFSNQSFINSAGIITASLASPGSNTFSYSASLGPCAALTSTTSFSVVPLPVLTISGNTTICQGQSTNLLAGGANTYTWTGFATGPIISVSPVVSTTYSVSGTNISTGCSGQTSIAVNVMPSPSLSVTGDFNICPGQTAMLLVSGAFTYTWNNGSNLSFINVNPTVTTSYSVSGTDFNSCTTTKTVSINVQNCSGIEELQRAQIKIFPNPTKDVLSIESSQPVNIVVYDALANVIFEKHLEGTKITVDLSAYNNGVYFVKTTNAGESKIYKVIKNN